MVIKFGDGTDSATISPILDTLMGWSVKLECSGPQRFPEHCAIHSANLDSVVVCDVSDDGTPLPNSLYHVGYDEIISITVL